MFWCLCIHSVDTLEIRIKDVLLVYACGYKRKEAQTIVCASLFATGNQAADAYGQTRVRRPAADC